MDKLCRRKLSLNYAFPDRPVEYMYYVYTYRARLYILLVDSSFPSEFGNIRLINCTFLAKFSQLLSNRSPSFFNKCKNFPANARFFIIQGTHLPNGQYLCSKVNITALFKYVYEKKVFYSASVV